MQSVATQDDSFWDRYWSDATLVPNDYFALITADDIRNLRENASGNLTALCFKVMTHTVILKWITETVSGICGCRLEHCNCSSMDRLSNGSASTLVCIVILLFWLSGFSARVNIHC